MQQNHGPNVFILSSEIFLSGMKLDEDSASIFFPFQFTITHSLFCFISGRCLLAVLFGLLRSIVHGLKAQLSVSSQKFGLS